MSVSFKINLTCFTVVLLWLFSACGQEREGNASPALKDAFKNDFYMGVAVNRSVVNGEDPKATQLIENQYNSITAENDHKWQNVHPEIGKYNFEPGDKLIELGRKNNMFIVGHVLIWHSQTPRWVFQDNDGNEISRDSLLARMKDHIYTVAGHFKDINVWDVVNEAFNDDGSLRISPYNL